MIIDVRQPKISRGKLGVDANRLLVRLGSSGKITERRQRPVVRVGYDVTLSTEKSVAVLALLSGAVRTNSPTAGSFSTFGSLKSPKPVHAPVLRDSF